MKRKPPRRIVVFIQVTFFLFLTFHIYLFIQPDFSGKDDPFPRKLSRSKRRNVEKDRDVQLSLMEYNGVTEEEGVMMTEVEVEDVMITEVDEVVIAEVEDENITTKRTIRSMTDQTKVGIKMDTSPLEILMWASPQILKIRRERLEKLSDGMNSINCFEGCRMSVGGNQFEADGADAILFFMFNIGYTRNELPTRKSWDQIWIYHQLEPPSYFSPGEHLNHQFNWTMTYRQDSDITQPYGQIMPLNSTSEAPYFGDHVNLQDWINGKKYLAAAVVSKCKTFSKREEIFKKLDDTGIPIHFYGDCTDQTVCKRYGENCTNFWANLSLKYKFFLAFENSLCSDYITEKFWRSLDLGMVPIVFGKGSYLEVAPPNSYIDIRNFSSPKELKDYLQKLDNDPEEYSKYFEWRKHYIIKNKEIDFCDVCGKLKEHRRRREENVKAVGAYESKIYDDLTGWWSTEPGHPDNSACLHPEEMGLERFLE